MKIDVLSLIEEALISGRNGEMAYIYNNPLMEQIYRDWRNNKQTDNTFRDFLLECLSTEQESCNIQTVTTYKPIVKKFTLDKYSEKYKEYHRIQDKIIELQMDKQKILKEIAETTSKALADIGTYELKYGEYGNYIEFKVNVEEITKLEEVKEKE